MAYSDYGGYAYRNGERVVDRSDCTITPEGDTFGTPGSWPGFAMMAQGVPHEEVQKRMEWPSGHVVLGDGPYYVVLYKQTYTALYHGPDKLVDFGFDWHREDEVEQKLEHAFEGYLLEIIYAQEDNFYQYVRLTQPDGNVWHGWSGYGVGAGLEDGGHGYSTRDREDRVWELFSRPCANDSDGESDSHATQVVDFVQLG